MGDWTVSGQSGGIWTMSAGTLLLTAGIVKLGLHERGLDWDGRPVVKKP